MTVTIAALAVGLWCVPGATASLFYEREALLRGEVWRALTGHLMHYSGSHLFWNLAVWIPAGAWAEQIAPRSTRGVMLTAAIVISAGILVLDRALDTYGGLSGMAAALLGFLALLQLERTPRGRWIWGGVLILLGGKIVVETVTRETALAHFASPEIQPVPLAHLIGVMVAVGWFLLTRRAARKGA